MFMIHGTEPINWVYEIKERIKHYVGLKTTQLDKREIAYIEDELIPVMEKYIALCAQIDEENEEKEKQADYQLLSSLR